MPIVVGLFELPEAYFLGKKELFEELSIYEKEKDNPLLKNIGINEDQDEENRTLYKAFFSVLKDHDAYLRFVFITGATKFSKVSIFSDLNQLNDISLNSDFDAICGITQDEMESNFKPEIIARKIRIRFLFYIRAAILQ